MSVLYWEAQSKNSIVTNPQEIGKIGLQCNPLYLFENKSHFERML